MKISVVVPVHNEAENITPLIQEINSALSEKHEYEIIFVDDGSSDQTPSRLQHLLKDFPQLHPIYHLQCCGQSTALLTGIRNAVNPVIVTLDGDGQNDPSDINKLLQIYESTKTKHLMIIGHRRLRQDSGWRKLSSGIANNIRRRLLRDETPDTGCGLKVFSRELFLNLPYFDHMHRFLPALVKRTGGEIISVEVNHRPRENGHSHYGTIDRLAVGIVDLLGAMWLMRRAKIPKISKNRPAANRHKRNLTAPDSTFSRIEQIRKF